MTKKGCWAVKRWNHVMFVCGSGRLRNRVSLPATKVDSPV